MKFGQVRGIFLCSGRAKSNFGVDCEVRVVALICKEERDTGSCTGRVIERELCEGQKFSPVVLLVVTVDSEVLFQGLIHPLSLSITF